MLHIAFCIWQSPFYQFLILDVQRGELRLLKPTKTLYNLKPPLVDSCIEEIAQIHRSRAKLAHRWPSNGHLRLRKRNPTSCWRLRPIRVIIEPPCSEHFEHVLLADGASKHSASDAVRPCRSTCASQAHAWHLNLLEAVASSCSEAHVANLSTFAWRVVWLKMPQLLAGIIFQNPQDLETSQNRKTYNPRALNPKTQTIKRSKSWSCESCDHQARRRNADALKPLKTLNPNSHYIIQTRTLKTKHTGRAHLYRKGAFIIKNAFIIKGRIYYILEGRIYCGKAHLFAGRTHL